MAFSFLSPSPLLAVVLPTSLCLLFYRAATTIYHANGMTPSRSTSALLLCILHLQLFTSTAFAPARSIAPLATSSTYTCLRMATSTNQSPNDTELQSLLSVAVAASKKAGEIILGNAGGADVTKSKANSRDLLTLIDPLCEKVSSFTLIGYIQPEFVLQV